MLASMSTARPILTLAHSPDPDDVFMWWPITGMIDPRDHTRVLSPPELDTGGFEFRALPEDIAVLNRRAIECGDLDLTALSMFTYAHVQDHYILTSCGSSVGDNYGPKIVAPSASLPEGTADSTAAGDETRPGDEVGRRVREWLRNALARDSHARIAVPGVKTTAFACLAMLMEWTGERDWQSRVIEMPFDQILRAVSSGRVDSFSTANASAKVNADRGDESNEVRIVAGLLIHQSQLTYGEFGLTQVIDFGRWWRHRTGMALPLGGNALRRDLEDRFGKGTLQRLADLLLASIRYALEQRERSIRYAMTFAPEIDFAQADRYIDMYVNEATVSLDAGAGPGGSQVGGGATRDDSMVRGLIDAAAERALCPALSRSVPHVVWARPLA